MDSAPERKNKSAIRTPTRAKSEQACSLDVLAGALRRARPGHPAAQHISNLIQQLGNYERNPDSLRVLIILSMRRIQEART